MSWDRCAKCGDLVNTDNEPESYVEDANGDYRCLCHEHREAYEAYLDRIAQMEYESEQIRTDK